LRWLVSEPCGHIQIEGANAPDLASLKLTSALLWYWCFGFCRLWGVSPERELTALNP